MNLIDTLIMAIHGFKQSNKRRPTKIRIHPNALAELSLTKEIKFRDIPVIMDSTIQTKGIELE